MKESQATCPWLFLLPVASLYPVCDTPRYSAIFDRRLSQRSAAGAAATRQAAILLEQQGLIERRRPQGGDASVLRLGRRRRTWCGRRDPGAGGEQPFFVYAMLPARLKQQALD